VIDEQEQGESIFVRSARGDGTGIISMPAEMQEAARESVLANWTDWSLGYLFQCGHHYDELRQVSQSLHDVLAQWWDARNSFDRPEDEPQFFPEGKQWNVFWKPSTASINCNAEEGESDEREQAIWRDGHEQGWNDCLHEWEAQEKLKRSGFCERIASWFRKTKR
jgi:hypothetical protein